MIFLLIQKKTSHTFPPAKHPLTTIYTMYIPKSHHKKHFQRFAIDLC